MTRRTLDQQHAIVESVHAFDILLDQREIFIHGEVDEDGDLGDGFLKNLRILETRSTTKPIVVHQHSLGGDWANGVIIHDAIVACPSPVLLLCHGTAASMGTVISTACVKHENAYCVTMPNCDWLVHQGNTDICPSLTYKQSLSWHQWEKRTASIMVDWYVQSCKHGSHFTGWSDKRVKTFLTKKMDLKEDWWLSAREAVEFGFADAVLGDKGYESIPDIIKTWEE